ncbi:hypothetical protein [Haloquadratum walsbyi]|uniref:hypothetical protein n=1 Tax=Haloquadratum walsbyi TaxID=293091 RepID=UPI0023F36D30|nr:hypothetical protein [Haloquadratum walsbyi]
MPPPSPPRSKSDTSTPRSARSRAIPAPVAPPPIIATGNTINDYVIQSLVIYRFTREV